VVIEYTGKNDMFPIKGRATGKTYRFGSGGHRIRKVWAADAPTFDAMPNMFRRIDQVEKFEPVLGAKGA
jgi:hypothetical protein